MPCFDPQHGFRSATGGFAFARKQSPTGERLTVPCGKCEGCVAQNVQMWGMRLQHEASLHASNCFVTLTYRDEDLPPFGSARMADFSAFMKRLRKRIYPAKVRFFGAPEYGPKTLRPHYHAALFGVDFDDKILMRTTEAGYPSYSSKLLNEIWGLGNCELSDLTSKSGRYVAGYVLDKYKNPLPEEFFSGVDPATGRRFERERPRARMSTNPGLGSRWADEYLDDCFPSGFVTLEGSKIAVPRYYRKRLKGRFELPGSSQAGLGRDDADVMTRRRRDYAQKNPGSIREQQPDRLAVREEVFRRRLERLKRDFG